MFLFTDDFNVFDVLKSVDALGRMQNGRITDGRSSAADITVRGSF